MEIITQTAGAVTDFLHNPLRNTQHNDGNFERESALIEGVEGPSLAASDLAETQSAGSAKNPAPGVAHLRSRRLPGADPMDNPKLLSALRLARRWTLSVFPVIENGKSPAFAGWQSAATNNPGQIRRWWEENPHYNIGIDTQRLLVLDVDARKGGIENFKVWLATMAIIGNELPRTLRVKTAGGGYHIIYRLPWKVYVSNKQNRPVAGVDIRSNGGLIVGAGSTIDYGDGEGPKRYMIMDDVPIAEAPEWLLDEIKRARPKPKNAGKRVGEETEWAVERAWKLMEKWPAGDDPDAGDGAAYQHAAQLADLGLEPETTFEIVGTWNERLDDPMDLERIEKKVENAYAYRQEPIGILAPSTAGFEPEEMAAQVPLLPEQATSPIAGPTLVRQFDIGAIPPRPWVVHPVLCKRTVMALAGPGGTNKSTWLLQLGVAIATGRSDIAGLPMREPKKVWVWNQEDDAEELRRRLAAIMLQFNVSFDDLGDRLYLDSGVEHPFMLARKMGDNTIKQTGDVVATIKWVSNNGIEALLLDPLAELHEANEVDNTQMRMVLGQARRIAVEADCAVGIAAHTPKRSRANIDELVGDVAALRGGGSQGGLTRMVYTMMPMSDRTAKDYVLPPVGSSTSSKR